MGFITDVLLWNEKIPGRGTCSSWGGPTSWHSKYGRWEKSVSCTGYSVPPFKYEFDFDAPISYALTHVYVTTDASTPAGTLMIAAYNRNNNGDEDAPLSSNVPISDFFSDTPLGENVTTGANEYYIKLTEDFNVIEGQEMTVKFWSTTPLVFVGGDVFVPSIGANQLQPKYDFTLTEMNFVKNLLSSIQRGSTPPSDTEELWFNTEDEIIYYYDGNDWLSQQIFTVEFNDQGSTPNNTFLRVGNTTTNQNGVGYNVPFDCRLVGLSFSRNPGTAQLGNYWLYSDSIASPSSVIATFTVDNSARGFVEPLSQTDVLANKYLAIRWNGIQTNNNIVTLQYRKKYS